MATKKSATTEAPSDAGVEDPPYDATRTRYEIVYQADSAIAQAEGTIGNHTHVMTRKIRLPDGRIERVPVLTGDAVRHQLREAAAYALLDRAGIRGGLSEAALRLFFNGGMLTGRGDANAIKLTEFRALANLLPTLPLFGGCCNNHLIPGQLAVSDLVLWCEETAALASPWQAEYLRDAGGEVGAARAHVDEEQRVRFDPTRRKDTARLLSSGAADHVARLVEASETAHADDDAVGREASKSSMFPRTCEVLVPGSLFYGEITVTTYTALELDAFHVALLTWLGAPRVGGKQGTGHGRLRALAANRVPLARPRDAGERVDFAALAPQVGALFAAHAREHADAIRQALAAVDA